jgi:hypothetical protein
MSYDYLTCWLRSVDEARELLTTHVASQQAAATRFLGPPPFSPTHPGEGSDEDYVASSSQDTGTTSLVTSTTQSSTRTYISATGTLSDTVPWGQSLDDGLSYDSLSDAALSVLDSIGFHPQAPSPMSGSDIHQPYIFFCQSLDSEDASDVDSLLGPTS